MLILDLIPAQYRAVAAALVLLLLAVIAAGSAWQVQAWRYDKRLADQSAAIAQDAQSRAWATVGVLQEAKQAREALEAELAANDQTHQLELTNVRKTTQKLRDDLATTHLRLSVVLASGAGGGGQLPAVAGAGGVVHGGQRAELDPAHAQRIVAITGDGDEGLTALQACQGYVRAVVTGSQKTRQGP